MWKPRAPARVKDTIGHLLVKFKIQTWLRCQENKIKEPPWRQVRNLKEVRNGQKRFSNERRALFKFLLDLYRCRSFLKKIK